MAQVPRKINDEILRTTQEDILNVDYLVIRPMSERSVRLRLPFNSRFDEGDEINIFPCEEYIKIIPWNSNTEHSKSKTKKKSSILRSHTIFLKG